MNATIRAPKSGFLTIARSNFESQIQTFAWTQRLVVRTMLIYIHIAFMTDNPSDPAIGSKLKIWQCQENVAAQAWFHTANNHIVLFGKGKWTLPGVQLANHLYPLLDVCVDALGGILTNGMVVHTWPCEEHNTNQLWASWLDCLSGIPPPARLLFEIDSCIMYSVKWRTGNFDFPDDIAWQ